MDFISLCVKELIKKGITISFAESITGGLLASTVTDFSGSSIILSESYVVYSNQAKQKILGLLKSFFDNHSVYSTACVQEMTTKLREKTSTDVCIASSGVAGPEGGSKENPVGTVYYDIFYNKKHYPNKIQIHGTRLEKKQ